MARVEVKNLDLSIPPLTHYKGLNQVYTINAFEAFAGFKPNPDRSKYFVDEPSDSEDDTINSNGPLINALTVLKVFKSLIQLAHNPNSYSNWTAPQPRIPVHLSEGK